MDGKESVTKPFFRHQRTRQRYRLQNFKTEQGDPVTVPLTIKEHMDGEWVIEKIQLREAVAGAPWLRRRLYVSDNADKAGDFPFDSTQLAALAPPGSLVQRIDIGLLGGGAARTSLLAALDEGAGSVTYVGHGGYDVLADEGSSASLPIFLHGVLGFDPVTFHRAVQPTYKLGTN